MKTVNARAVDPAKPKDLQKKKPQLNSVNLSFAQIEERASARTEVLNAILAREERPDWRHWGLNE